MRKRNLRRFCVLILLLVGFVGSVFAQTDQLIYSNSLNNGWQNWSWATVDLSNSSPVHSAPCSISVTAGAYQALYLAQDPFDTSGYTNLTFWICGDPVGGQKLHVQAVLNGVAQSIVALPTLSPTNAWQQVTLSLASLGAAAAVWDAFHGLSIWWIAAP